MGADSTLELFVVEQGDMDQLGDDTVDDKVLEKNRKKRGREEGFGRTALFGWEGQEDGADVEGEAVKNEVKTNAMAVDDEDDDDDLVIVATGNNIKPPGRSTASSSKAGPSNSRRSQRDVEKSKADDNVSESEENSKIPCPGCTFLNDEQLRECEMCQSALR